MDLIRNSRNGRKEDKQDRRTTAHLRPGTEVVTAFIYYYLTDNAMKTKCTWLITSNCIDLKPPAAYCIMGENIHVLS